MHVINRFLGFMVWGVLVVMASCASPQTPSDGLSPSGVPLNLIPMYGHPDLQKSERLKQVDARFIASVLAEGGSREQAVKGFVAQGWHHLQADEVDMAMRRFNQAWLLDANHYMPYWGFGAVLSARHELDASMWHYQKALALLTQLGDVGQKHRLLTDTARTYALQGLELKERDPKRAKEHFDQAHAMLAEAVQRVPTYGNTYRTWAIALYMEDDYAQAWQMVKTLRRLGEADPPQDFLDALSRKMPEPQ
jgi:tetratricopeptide (TPR) repeat protein